MALRQYGASQREYVNPVQPQQQPQQPQRQNAPVTQPSHRPRRQWTKGEKFLLIAFTLIIAITAVYSLHTQSAISETTVDIAGLDKKVTVLHKENEELANEVAEKSTYERFVKKAKELGLTPNADNIKAVSKE